MVIEFLCIYTLGLLILALIGNGILSYLTAHKPLKISLLESFALSLSLGFIFIILYTYCIDLLVKWVGFITNSQFVILVLFPTCLGALLKLTSIKSRLGKGTPLKAVFANLSEQWKQKSRPYLEQFKNLLRDRRKLLRTMLIIGVIGIVFGFMTERIYDVFELDPGQLYFDPYFWIYNINYYVKTLTFDYTSLHGYAGGIVSIGAFFLSIFPNISFSYQFDFLKWFQFCNFFLFVFLLYSIHKRISKKPLLFLIAFLFTFNNYFYFRFDALVPSPFTIIFLELFILQTIIPEVPRFLCYLTLGITLLIHPLNGAIICGFFIAYELIKWGVKGLHYLKANRRPLHGIILFIKSRLGKNFIWNMIGFIIPIAVFSLNLTIRWSPFWFLYYFNIVETGVAIGSSISPLTPLVSQNFPLLTVFENIFLNWSILLDRVGWIFSWGNRFFWLTLICIFIPQRLYVDSEKKDGVVLFLRISLLLGIILFTFRSYEFLLNFIEILPGGSEIITIFNSTFFLWASERIFEVSNVLNAIFLAIILEWGIKKIFKTSQNRPKGKKIPIGDTICISILIASLFTLSYSQGIPYEYSLDSRYIDATLWFRDYLDQNDPGAKNISYSREDAVLPYPLYCTFTPGRSFTQLDYNVSVSFIISNFTSNPDNKIPYLIISFNKMTEAIADDVRSTFVGSSFQLHYNILILILKFPI